MTAWEEMRSGALYRAGDPDLAARRRRAQRLMKSYNATTLEDADTRREILGDLLGRIGEGSVLRAPIFVDYGENILIGRGVFLNYNCVLLDVCPIEIGDQTEIGPAVQIYAADHPRDPAVRAKGLECGKPVTIGQNVWIGGGAILLPGITVGDNAIIGAGSVVTRDVAPGQTVKGNPAR